MRSVTFKYLPKAIVLVCLFMLSACVTVPKPMPDPTNPIHSVVILPFTNFSNNIGAPGHLRELLATKMKVKFYDVMDLAKVDTILEDQFGITLGEHVEDVDFKDIHAILGADAYVFGDVTHYDQVITGVLNTNRVKADVKMIQTSSNTVFWSNNIGIKSESKGGGLIGDVASLSSTVSDINEEEIKWITIESESGGDGSIFGNLVAGVVDQVVSNMTETVLTEESVAWVDHTAHNLRQGPGF